MELFRERLENTRKKLLDLTRRNRLINYRRPAKSRDVWIIDESPEFIYQYLLFQEKSFKFKSIPYPSREFDDIEDEPDVKEEAEKIGFHVSKEMPEITLSEYNKKNKYTDNYLQTLHFPSELERLLKKVELSSRNIIQETGSNMLYLVLGILEWRDRDDEKRSLRSPLVMLPVLLTREVLNKTTRTYEFSIKYSGDLVSRNESLAEKLKLDFDIELPELSESISFSDYIHEVEKICSSRADWKIRQEISLDFLQFGKILMYRDLNPDNWQDQTLEKNQLLQDLFMGRAKNDPIYAPEEYDIDYHETARDIPLVLDADSSQHSAIVDVLGGKNVVIEGPPGTGKSQSIANMIATLMAEGKSVLFISEKLVALEVVYQRLAEIGLGDFCLELHSHKTDKKRLLQNLKKRISGRYNAPSQLKREKNRLEIRKRELRNYLEILHRPYGNEERRLFELFWLRERYYDTSDYLEFTVSNAESLESSHINYSIVEIQRYESFFENYELESFFWQGFHPQNLSFLDIDRVIRYFIGLKNIYMELDGVIKESSLVISDELSELKKIDLFVDGFIWDKELYFSYDKIDAFRYLKRKLDAYLEAFHRFSTQSDLEMVETEEMIFSVKNSFSILTDLSTIESSLSHEIPLYRRFIEKAEEQYHQFEQIASNSTTYLHALSLTTKSVDELIFIANVVNEKKDSFFRFLFADYRRSKREFASLLIGELPNNSDEWIAPLRDLNIYALNLQNKRTLRKSLQRQILSFVKKVKTLSSNIEKTLDQYDYISSSSLDKELKNRLFIDIEVVDKLKKISSIYINRLVDEVTIYGKIENRFFAHGAVSMEQCIQKLNSIDGHKHSLSVWIDLKKQAHILRGLGLSTIVEYVESGRLPPKRAKDNFYYNYYNSLIKNILAKETLLIGFNRASHEKMIEKFRDLDVGILEKHKLYVAFKASGREMPPSEGKGRVATFTNLKLINHEIGKKRRHVPIRQLIYRAGGALQSLKPCFMMSPLSVSQYLEPNAISFDVLVIDEASQLRPEEALGVIARADQVVIVGDPKQLPPTSFFQIVKEQHDEDETILDESESILDSCIELYNPVRRLKWHYRSQHESLIDFSNRHFYDQDLMIFPSPMSIKGDLLGVKYTYVEDGRYQGGATYRHNRREAEVVIEHIIQQMEHFPKRSLGVGTFNSSQKELLQDMIDREEKRSPIVREYIERWSQSGEPFFVKNLESLQGDERDVIFISTTYGADIDHGRVMQRFGPINQEGGWRRLNVLITRAKQKMHIFSSLKSSDISISIDSSRGVKSLKEFLKFLERGAVAPKREEAEKPIESLFSHAIGRLLSSRGVRTRSHVGVSGYYIDLVVLAEDSDDAILAIECDGENYYASKSASDRDRLKGEVLRRLGWRVHKIWSVDWYKNREDEVERLFDVISQAREYNQD